MKTKEIVDWIAQEQIINLPWINRSQINSLIPLGKKKLSQRMNDLEFYLTSENIAYYDDTRPRLYPTSETLKFFKIDINTIIKQENLQRKYLIKERQENEKEISS